jgi:hypothetical protein
VLLGSLLVSGYSGGGWSAKVRIAKPHSKCVYRT